LAVHDFHNHLLTLETEKESGPEARYGHWRFSKPSLPE